MEQAQTILVIIVSSLLSLALLLGIIVLVMAIRLAKTVRRVVEKAEQVIQSAEAATEVLKNAGGPLAMLKIIRNIMKLADKFRK
jgi:hypothetical protein